MFFILSPTLVFSQSRADLREQIDKLIRHDTEISFDQTPGFIIGIIDGDSSYILPYGVTEPGVDSQLTAKDIFELGSLTKVMTAEIILRLYAQKKLELDHQLNDFLEEEYRNPRFTGTLRDLLMHRSGLPKIPETTGSTLSDLDNPYSGFTKIDLLSWFQGVDPGPAGVFRYSHTGYALLELVIEKVTGEPFTQVFNRYITEEYALDHTQVLLRSSITPGFDLARRKVVPRSLQSFRASEGAMSSLSDLMKYVRALMTDEEIPLMWNTSQSTNEKKLRAAPGWYLFLPKKTFPVYVHTGRTSGHSAMATFSRTTKTGVIILSNSSAGTDDLGLLILRMINRQWRRK